jgi:hypothetical protein
VTNMGNMHVSFDESSFLPVAFWSMRSAVRSRNLVREPGGKEGRKKSQLKLSSY